MVIAGLGKRSDIVSKELARYRMRKGFYVKGIGSAWTLMTQGALDYGIQVQTIAMANDLYGTVGCPSSDHLFDRTG